MPTTPLSYRKEKQINVTYPPLPARILPIDGEEIEDDDIDNVDGLYDLLCLREILWKINGRIISLRHPPFWKTPAEKLQDFRISLYYEDLRELVYEAIDEICCTPIYDDSDDNFDDYDSFDEEQDPHFILFIFITSHLHHIFQFSFVHYL